jgi:DNA modification methylase
MGKKFIGIEIQPEYFDLACQRVTNALRQERLFA